VRWLYGVTEKQLPKEIERNVVIDDILSNWQSPKEGVPLCLFSVTQISERTGVKRQKVRRIVNKLVKLGIVANYSKEKNQKNS
jgi:DNA-binding MarR family transcriptional regulator